MSEEATGTITVIDGWRFRFIRGDANADLTVDISDAQAISDWLFLGLPAAEPGCFDAADANDDSRVSIGDSIAIYNWLFHGGPPPPAPFPSPGADETPDLLGCRTYHARGAVGF